MDARTYELRRDELVQLIDEVLGLCAIPAKTAESLMAVRRKVYENQFRIVLVSGFECGKSTTFNLLCDGREISPRGLMVPTSATIVSAQNTMDEELADKASIVWRSDRELTLIFAKHLLRYFHELEPTRFKDVNQAEQLCDVLSYPEDLPLLRRVVSKNMADIERAGTSEEAERNALLMAHLIAQHYDSPWLAAQKRRTDFTVEEISRMICFPDNYQSRAWIGVPPCEFSAEESVFAFIRQAHCYIQSENLKRTGSVIIDCPGLFSSTYDTNVALDVVENADAVWFILNGRGLGASDLDPIKQIIAAKPDRVFFTVNLAQNTERNVRSQIVNSYSREIENVTGKRIAPEEFSVYHALLGLTVLQAERFSKGKLDEHTLSEIKRISRHFRSGTDDPKEALNEAAINSLTSSYGFSWREAARVDLFAPAGDWINLCRRQSGVGEIISRVESEVVSKKAKSILIDNGARRAIDLIFAVESDLKVSEDLAQADELKMQCAFEEAEERLTKFSEFCEDQLDDLRGVSTDLILADDYWREVIDSSIDEVAERAARQIAETNLNEVRQELNEQIINDTFSEVVRPKAVAWADRIKTGRHQIFDDLVGKPMRRIVRDTLQKWEVVIKDQPILAGLPPPTPLWGTEVMNTELIESVVAKAPGVSTDVIVGTTVGVAVGAMIGSFVFPFIGTYLGCALGGVIGAVFGGGVGTNSREQQIYEGVKQSLIASIAEPQRKSEVVSRQAKRIEALRMGIIREFQTAFEQPMNALIARHEETMNLFSEQAERRKAIAEEHRKLRVEKLEPLRAQIARFERMVMDDLGKGAARRDARIVNQVKSYR